MADGVSEVTSNKFRQASEEQRHKPIFRSTDVPQHVFIVGLMGCFSLASAAFAQSGAPPTGADAARGRAIANTVCWACHVVGPDQEFSPILRDPGPDFRVIANRPGTSRQSLKAFLQTTHSLESKPYAMPNPRLTDEMIEEVAQYIMSLTKRP